MALKVAIVGGSPSTQFDAPFDNPDWEIWVHGNQMDRYQNRRVTKIFEIHDDLSEHESWYPEWLVKSGIPMVVGKAFPLSAAHVERFPFDEANKLLGGEHLTSTPAYMMAYALLHGASHIAIYGVDMAVDDHEYFYQRPTMYAWIAYAKAKGVEVTIPDASPLFKDTFVEGRSSGGKPNLALAPFTYSGFTEMAQLHAAKIADYETKIMDMQNLIRTHSGCQQSYERLAKVARAVESGQAISSLKDSAKLR